MIIKLISILGGILIGHWIWNIESRIKRLEEDSSRKNIPSKYLIQSTDEN